MNPDHENTEATATENAAADKPQTAATYVTAAAVKSETAALDKPETAATNAPRTADKNEAATTDKSEISAEVLNTLAEIGEEVNSSLDLDEVLARSAALIKRHIDYEIFGILLMEGGGSYLKHRFSIGYPLSLAENLRVPVGQGITGTAAATAHSVRVSDTTTDARYISAIE